MISSIGKTCLIRLIVVGLLSTAAIVTNALETPCEDRFVGDECVFDEECYGPNTRCHRSFCTCMPGFDTMTQSDATGEREIKVCVAGGREEGDICNDEFGCQPPMICRLGPNDDNNRRCECFGGSWDKSSKKCIVDAAEECGSGEDLVGHECQKVVKLGDPCDSDQECRDPMAVCQSGPPESSRCSSNDGVRGGSGKKKAKRKRPKTSALKAALKKCQKKKTKASRRLCEARARRKHGSKPTRGKRQNQRVCRCAAGTQRCGNACIASCPDGSAPLKMSCRRLFLNDRDVLAHKERLDECPDGYSCIDYGKPGVGHCCRAYCPYGDPVTGKTCDIGEKNPVKKCRQLTHFCHEVGGPGWKHAFCCPRPCREPTPLLVNGKCLSVAHRDDPCETDEQCEGGSTMECKLSKNDKKKGRPGKCTCLSRGNYKYVKSVNGPYKTCVKKCNDKKEVMVEKSCLPTRKLGKTCMSSRQCPVGSYCYYGICKCKCGYTRTGGSICISTGDPFGQLGELGSQLFGQLFSKGSSN